MTSEPSIPTEGVKALFTKVGLACFILFLSALFIFLPTGLFTDLTKADWYWGCPATVYVFEQSGDGNFSEWQCKHILFNLLFWTIYFSLAGFAFKKILRKIGLKIRPFYSLCVVAILTGSLYAFLFRPYALINLETGGYLRFLESRDEQIDQAMRFGQLETFQAMLKKNPALALSTNITGDTPLETAAYYGQYQIAKLLLANKASARAKGWCGDTPLFCSALNGYLGVTELLIKNGADVNVKDDNGETPLFAAAECGDNRVVNLLLANKADVNVRGSDGYTPLLEAAWRGHKATVQLLIASNAEVNVKDNQGEMPLHLTAENENKDIVKLLLANKAEVNARDMYGRTPLQIALDYGGSNDVVQLLRQYGGTNN